MQQLINGHIKQRKCLYFAFAYSFFFVISCFLYLLILTASIFLPIYSYWNIRYFVTHSVIFCSISSIIIIWMILYLLATILNNVFVKFLIFDLFQFLEIFHWKASRKLFFIEAICDKYNDNCFFMDSKSPFLIFDLHKAVTEFSEAALTSQSKHSLLAGLIILKHLALD